MLRSHQVLSGLAAYSVWRHITKQPLFGIYIYVPGGLFLVLFSAQLCLVLYRNNGKLSHARISYKFGVIRIRLHLSKPLKIEAGQYISLWIPYTSIGSLTQSHPFTVVSWSDKPQSFLDLFIQPRKGFTKNVLNLAQYGDTTSIAAFSGPHGNIFPMHQYQNILMVATGFGIAAHLAYLKKLINDRRHHDARVRRIHLVWHLGESGMSYTAILSVNLADG